MLGSAMFEFYLAHAWTAIATTLAIVAASTPAAGYSYNFYSYSTVCCCYCEQSYFYCSMKCCWYCHSNYARWLNWLLLAWEQDEFVVVVTDAAADEN